MGIAIRWKSLTFFGVKENSKVVEILPGSRGYFLEILAPYLKAQGVVYRGQSR